MADLTCPKCESPMRSYERSGITIDQCTGCRGVFLDRGELERLVDAEGAYYEGGGAGHREPEREYRRERDWDDDDDERRGGFGGLGGFGGGHGKRRKREGFLGELFD
jgi:Zn-finger nucleic acid-binding protein